jgi:hypothetical protein
LRRNSPQSIVGRRSSIRKIARERQARPRKLLADIDLGALGKKKVAAETARNYFNVYGHEF